MNKKHDFFLLIWYSLLFRCVLLVDRTNGRTYATVLSPSVVCLSSVTYVL